MARKSHLGIPENPITFVAALQRPLYMYVYTYIYTDTQHCYKTAKNRRTSGWEIEDLIDSAERKGNWVFPRRYARSMQRQVRYNSAPKRSLREIVFRR